jgi:D-alanine--poly(phosphoribitol) ligase subunit 2
MPDEVDLLLLDLIREQLNVDVTDTDADLIGTGLVDSLALVMLIAALEESFACELPLDDFDLENFRTVRRLRAFLEVSGVLKSHESWPEVRRSNG